jgi:fructose-specific phosphotransferase system IIA component
MEIDSLITENLITLELQATDHDSAIEALANLMEKEGKLLSKKQFIQDVKNREKMTSTEVGHGIAIPHARSAAVGETAIAFGRSEGFYWNNDVEELTRMVFLLAVSKANPNNQYIHMLASLARMLVHDDFRERLAQAERRQDVLLAIRDVKGR